MDPRVRRAVRGLAAVLAAVVVGLIGVELFVQRPADLADLFGTLIVVAAIVIAVRLAVGAVAGLLPDFNVAEVAVDGPITRGREGPLPSAPTSPGADDIVEQIERADETDAVEALIVKLNTPGGQVVPSEDIRLAAERFDGPTVAYATDTCASGGYLIASGCDELWAREGTVVGSIGVIGSRINAKELADRLGISYERIAAGEYKDAGIPLKEFEEDERAYLQGLVDDFYDAFVERVVTGRDMDPEAVRETEARLYIGTEAHERGLVDELGTREDVEDALETVLDEPVRIERFEPSRGITDRFRGGASAVAFAFGAGLASVLADERRPEFRL